MQNTSLAIPDLVSTKAMASSWLYNARMYELWIAIAGDLAHHIYFSNLPWPIGKILLWKKTYDVKKLLEVTILNCEEREAGVIHLPPLSFHISFETLPDLHHLILTVTETSY